MNQQPAPRKRVDKSDPAYMRAAYFYSAVLLLLGLLGGSILAYRITVAEQYDKALQEERAQQEALESSEAPEINGSTGGSGRN